MLDEALVNPFFVAAADGVEVQAVTLLEALDPFDVVVAHVLGPELVVADPARAAPGHAVEGNGRVPLLGLPHQPPFVAAEVVLIVLRVHVAGLGALRGVAVAGHFHEERSNRSAEFRLEEQIEDLAPLRLGIVLKRTEVAPPPLTAPMPSKRLPPAPPLSSTAWSASAGRQRPIRVQPTTARTARRCAAVSKDESWILSA